MKSNLRKVMSMMLCLAMVFAMMPNFSWGEVNASAENLIGSQGEGVTIEDNFPGENDKPEVLAAEPEDEAQLAEEIEKTGTWAEYILQSPQTMKYKYVDFSPFLDNDGNWKGPKNATISTAEQLAGLMVIVNADANTTIKDNKDRKITIKSTRISFSGCTIKLTEKIDLSVHEWVPIGKDENHSFSASLDGSATEDGICEIQGMKIGSESSPRDYSYAGLIGYYTGDSVTNIGIGENSEMDISICSRDWNDVRVGGIIGQVDKNSVILSNCYNMGNIKGYADNGNIFAGGIVGHAESSATLNDCYNTGNIEGHTEGEKIFVGGLVGYTKTEVRLENCYNTGTISGELVGGLNCVGGLVGHAEGCILENCYNTGTISGVFNVAGLVGDANEVRLENCCNTGTISGKYSVGGLGGFAKNGTLENCYNTGTISGDGTVGGLICGACPETEIRLENCYNTGTIINNKPETISGNATGGLVGFIWIYGEVRLKNCYNTGTINNKPGIISGKLVGGLVGESRSEVRLENCYYLGATQGVGNKADEESGAINLLKDAQKNAQTESVELRPNEIKTIPNTEANVELREVNTTEGASQKLGAGFKMEYVYDTPENVTTGLRGNKNELQIAAREGAKSGKVTLTGIKVTQNGLTANGYTGAPSTFKIDVNKGTSFDLRVKYTLSFDPNGGEWVGTQPKRIKYTQGEGSDVALPTSEKIKIDGYTFVGWNTQEDGSGDYIKKIDKNLAISKLYAQFD